MSTNAWVARLLVLVLLAGPVAAQAAPPAAVTPPANAPADSPLQVGQPTVQAQSDAKSGDGATREFAGLKFGAGIFLTFDTGKNRRVGTASIAANGIVRVDEINDSPTRVTLESHYFLAPGKKRSFGFGPFMAIHPGTEELINAMGVGVMVGFRRKDEEDDPTRGSFNIALGYAMDPKTKLLGEEFVNGRAAPTDAAGTPLPIRYRWREQGGILVLFSFSWYCVPTQRMPRASRVSVVRAMDSGYARDDR